MEQEIKKLIALLQRNWSALENIVRSVDSLDGFSEFLASYRGSAVSSQTDVNSEHREEKVQQIVGFFQRFFSQIEIAGELECQHLVALEKALNTALYYAYFNNDRNFQFRTFIHFLQIQSFDFSVRFGTAEIRILVNEFGFSITLDDAFSAFPKRFSLARVNGLSHFQRVSEPSPDSEVAVFEKIRTLQREFCFLIDEWEHLNSILAVEQFALRKSQSLESQDARKKMSVISEKRDGLALWCIESTADFQDFLSRVKEVEGLSMDVHSEVDALDALILSGVQKYLLPASVSRHVYGKDVLNELWRWVRVRKRNEPDDLYLHMADFAFSLALGLKSGELEIYKMLSGRSSDWVLSADPSAVIKAVAWGLSSKEYKCLTIALIVALDSKTSPQSLDSYWLHTIASVIEMPGTFACAQKLDSSSEVLEDLPQILIDKALGAIDKSMQNVDEELQQVGSFIKEHLLTEIITQP